MIHDITIAWPNKNLDSEIGLKDVLGDTIVINLTIDGIDLSDYKIRGEIYDGSNSFELANLLSGGSDSQIIATEVDSGMSGFQVTIPAGATNNYLNIAWIDIEIEDTLGRVFTILQQQINFLDREIGWHDPS